MIYEKACSFPLQKVVWSHWMSDTIIHDVVKNPFLSFYNSSIKINTDINDLRWKNRPIPLANISLNDDKSVVKDQNRVAEILVNHFLTIADGIWGNVNTELSFMVNFADQPIVLRIAHSMRSMRMFDLERNSAKQVHEVLQKLDANKASGYDAIQIKISDDWRCRTSLPNLQFTNFSTFALKKESGRLSRKKGSRHLFLNRMIAVRGKLSTHHNHFLRR